MRYLLAILFFTLLIGSCKRDEVYPVEPAISFKSLGVLQDNGLDSMAVIIVNFTDGDGDIGYRDNGQGDSIYDNPLSQYYFNFQVKMFEKIGSTWVHNDTAALGGRIPYLTPTGNNKALKGDIRMDVYLPYRRTNRTIYYEVFIYDRAFHKSNVVETSEIVINTRTF